MTKVRVLGLLFALAAAGIVFADVQVGEVRSAQARDGVALRDEPKPLATVVQVLAYGTRVTVQEVRGRFAKVAVQATGATGWVRASEIVEPPVLTGRTASAGEAGGATASDISAAGRQFDDATEAEYKASNADLAAAYPLVDALEKKTPPEREVEAFIRDGRLGR